MTTLISLCGNAVKYTRLGEGRLVVRAEGDDVEVASEPSRCATFRVWLPSAHGPAAA